MERASQRFHIPVEWIAAVMSAESAGRTEQHGRPITSSKGAMGLMQLMPETYAEMQRLYDLGTDPFAHGDNIMAGTAYLRLNFDRFGYPGLFAAYNAGPDRYARSLTGTRLPAETRAYLKVLIRTTASSVPRSDVILVDLAGNTVSPEPRVGNGLFVPLNPQ